MPITLSFDVLTDTSKARRELSKFDKTTKGTTDSAGMSFRKLGGAMKVAFAGIGVAALTRFGKQLWDTGRQVDVWSANNARVFGDDAARMSKWADENRRAFGVGSSELEGYVSSVGNWFVNAGAATDVAGELSTEFLEVANALAFTSAGQYDLASATEAMTGVFRGEFESLQTLGINIDAATVKTRAQSQATIDLAASLGISAEAAAGVSIIQEQAADDIEQTAERSDEAAVAMASDWAELRERMGESFGNIADDASTEALGMADAWSAGFDGTGKVQAGFWTEAAYKFGSGFRDLKDKSAGFWNEWAAGWSGAERAGNSNVGRIVHGLGIMGRQFWEVNQAIGRALRGIPGMFHSVGQSISGVGDWIGGILGGVSSAFHNVRSTFLLGLPSINLPFFDQGGVVGGPRGAAQLAVVHGGETILPTHKAGGVGMGPGRQYSIMVEVAAASPSDVGEAIVDSIRSFEAVDGTGWRSAV